MARLATAAPAFARGADIRRQKHQEAMASRINIPAALAGLGIGAITGGPMGALYGGIKGLGVSQLEGGPGVGRAAWSGLEAGLSAREKQETDKALMALAGASPEKREEMILKSPTLLKTFGPAMAQKWFPRPLSPMEQFMEMQIGSMFPKPESPPEKKPSIKLDQGYPIGTEAINNDTGQVEVWNGYNWVPKRTSIGMGSIGLGR